MSQGTPELLENKNKIFINLNKRLDKCKNGCITLGYLIVQRQLRCILKCSIYFTIYFRRDVFIFRQLVRGLWLFGVGGSNNQAAIIKIIKRNERATCRDSLVMDVQYVSKNTYW